MPDVLAEILTHKRGEVERRQRERPVSDLQRLVGYAAPRRNFYGAVSAPRRGGPNLIAEIKKRSPSAGLIRPAFDPVALAGRYEQAGAAALSVLTDEKYFEGRLEYIEAIKAEVGLPVLRKDFLVEPYQVHESRAYGADAILLIGEALAPERAQELAALARELELAVLLEVHSAPTLFATLAEFPEEHRRGLLVGLNNRDLKTQQIDLGVTQRLAGLVPPGIPIVAESGVKTRQDVARLHAAGARALLVGETLMRSTDIAKSVRELFGWRGDR